VAGAALALAILLVPAILATGSAQAQTYTESVLYSFTNSPDGIRPEADLVQDAQGNLYGTTYSGGSSRGGTVFEVDTTNQETVLYTFCSESGCTDGEWPLASLVRDAQGNLFGTTSEGGDSACTATDFAGCGTAFELLPPAKSGGAWTETVLHTFTGPPDGAISQAGLVQDAQGNLYGTTTSGGAYSFGTVFELLPPAKSGGTWTETVLYSFCSASGCADGATPLAGLLLDAQGNLYGTTECGANGGAYGSGTVFKLAPPAVEGGSWTETVLYSFCPVSGCADGANPLAGLILDAQGNLYGTTFAGGADGGGTVFRLSPPVQPSVKWGYAALYSFCSESNCTDGVNPWTGFLVRDAAGNLYGTTSGGGDPAACTGGCGTVFELLPPAKSGGPWTETLLHSFCPDGVPCSDGTTPEAGLVRDAQGNLYGTTEGGGDDYANCIDYGCGTVFKLAAAGTVTVTLSPTSLSFGSQAIDTTSAAKSVTVKNSGSVTLDIGSISVGTNFAISANTCGSTLGAGKKCKVSVTFTPTEPGSLTGTLSFADNASGSPQTVSLSGAGEAQATLTPSSHIFKETKVGDTSAAYKFTLKNNLNTTLTGISHSTTGPFSVSTTTCGTTLDSKKSCTISVAFSPTETGTATGTLTVKDSANDSPQTASLTGTGD
jgi:uncharacterized repeat protein (TIGR03803 family)